ncbi:MAG TPA: DHH family phosphoesterase [Methanotrichaceae archaeon]|nr:DHH family phosphoesterase [Methanotrichaceae archaeon]
MKRLEKTAEAIARSILRCDSMRVISHNDCDGITSAGLICSALTRASIPFHATLVKRLDESVIDSVGEGPVVFCDMGSGQPDLISKVKGEVFVLDHHRPVGTLSCLNLNPHNFGIDGAFELSASGTVYSVVRKMGDNADLAGLAIVGAIGDRQMMIGANRSILDEALEAGAVEVRPGLKMSEDGPVDQVFQSSIEPLLDFTGDKELTRQFLDQVGVHGDVQSLSKGDLSRLCTALVLKLLIQGSFAADSVVGEVIRLKNEVVENAFELVLLLNACGKMDVPGLGLTLCLRDDSVLSECRKVGADYKREVMSGIRYLQEHHKELDHIRYLIMPDMEAGGVVAGLGIRYLYTDRPLIVLNQKENMVKISGRGSKPMVVKGLDLSIALRTAAEAVGGRGGGHTIASGASIPPGTEEEFLRIADEVVGGQIQKENA